MTSPRIIPSIEHLLQRSGLAEALARAGHEPVVRAVRAAADDLRRQLAEASADAPSAADAGRHAPLPGDAAAAAEWIERRATARLASDRRASLRPVINATGVIVHTNLGRAPLAAPALEAAATVARSYANLEYDLDAGERGHRHVHAERLLCSLTGAEAALVANNNAAAMLLVLASVASGREVVVSRGELVEIGGGFRVPDVLAQSGASLREVGTTNRTRASDYAAAVGDRTGAILRVHPSNFRIEGFAERPALDELVAMARRFALPLVEDLGSGWLGLGDVEKIDALRDEPAVVASLRAGADLVAFSGDKLLGGPQCGIVVGRRALIDGARRHPLMRAVRADKTTYAMLEATLQLWAETPRRGEIPVYRMLTMRVDEIDRRARSLVGALAGIRTMRADVVDGASTIGGGSAPGSQLPTRLVAIDPTQGAATLADTLRHAEPPVIGRVEDGRVLLDLRTVAPDEDAVLLRTLQEL